MSSVERVLHSPITDAARLDAVARSGLLSADVEPAFDRWTRMAADLVGTPVALLTVLDDERMWVKSNFGMAPGDMEEHGKPYERTFCQHVVMNDERLVVTDAREDPRVRDNPAVSEVGVLSYVGQPVRSADGHVLGAFCVLDVVPREWDARQLALLEDLAAGLIAEVQLRSALETSLALQEDLARQARVDALTGIPNRRQLADDLAAAVAGDGPQVLAMFDLNGFKLYNDAFGHPAGDALLSRLSGKLAAVAAGSGGSAYRLGGDEFCVLVHDEDAVRDAAHALQERGEGFVITSAYGALRLVPGLVTAEQAMQTVDERLYGSKHSRVDAARRQAHDVLLGVLREREPELDAHVREVAVLARRVGEHLGLDAEALDEVGLAAEMHDIGKVAIPDSIIRKAGPLDPDEWALMRQHTLFGERILSAAPALRNVAAIVRSTHERWDGGGYPDKRAGEEIPLSARVVFVCDAFHAMTSDRPYAAARSVAEAKAELHRSAGTQFDLLVVEALDAMIAGV